VGQVVNLRPIVNRPAAFPENILPSAHYPFVATFHTRRLPHYHAVGQPIFLTWRLQGSLPANRSFPSASTSGQAFLAMDRILDNARTGPQYLRLPEIAQMVVEAIHYRDQRLRHYDLHRYVVMGNHVHLLITPQVEVSKLMQSLKRFTAREGNRILGLTGQTFWQDESYDRLVRGGAEFERIASYIEMNPVNAGLAPTPEDFPWSSARTTDNRQQVEDGGRLGGNCEAGQQAD
jgi:REP element-mobilizing transposase RayT